MTEIKPLEVAILTERVYNVNEVVADMKAMGGQVAEYALVMEKLCDIIKRQEKEFRAMNKDFGVAEAKAMELKAEVDTLKTRMKALVECDREKKSLCTECLLRNRKCNRKCDCENERTTAEDVETIKQNKGCFGCFFDEPWDDDEYCAGCKYRRMCELISVNEGEKK